MSSCFLRTFSINEREGKKLSLSSCYYYHCYNTSTSCKVANPLSPTILFICGSNGSSFDFSSIISITTGMLKDIPSSLMADLLRLPNPSTPFHKVAPEIFAPMRKSINKFCSRLPCNSSLRLILMIRHHTFILVIIFSYSCCCRILWYTAQSSSPKSLRYDCCQNSGKYC
jgi:hypothetical protein